MYRDPIKLSTLYNFRKDLLRTLNPFYQLSPVVIEMLTQLVCCKYLLLSEVPCITQWVNDIFTSLVQTVSTRLTPKALQ